jgi:hypothetical protein
MFTAFTAFTAGKRAAVATMAGAAAAAVVGLASPAGASPVAVRGPAVVTGTEHFQMTTTSGTASASPLIAYGVFTTPGVDHESGGATATFVFPGGTVKVRHSSGTGPQSFNPKTCLFQVTLHGTYTLTGGTGKYKGISGHGTYTLAILGIGAKSKGACSQTLPPVAWQQQIKASGPVRLP